MSDGYQFFDKISIDLNLSERPHAFYYVCIKFVLGFIFELSHAPMYKWQFKTFPDSLNCENRNSHLDRIIVCIYPNRISLCICQCRKKRGKLTQLTHINRRPILSLSSLTLNTLINWNEFWVTDCSFLIGYNKFSDGIVNKMK